MAGAARARVKAVTESKNTNFIPYLATVDSSVWS
jgi:hypothetical protein